MGSINYGSSIAANVDINDIELWFTKQSKNGVLSDPVKLDSTTYIKKTFNPFLVTQSISGLYELEIPPSFYLNNGNGTYNFYLTPKSFIVTIQDISFLDGTNVKGLIINLNGLDSYSKNKLKIDKNLSGYIIRYVDLNNSDDNIVNSLEKLITSNYLVEPISASLNSNNNQYGVRYRLNSTSDTVFLVVNPSSNGITETLDNLFIGAVGQEIVITNTFFEPQLIKIEFNDIDINTIYQGVFGNQTFNYDKGLRTFYDEEGNIIAQRTESTIKDELDADLKKIAKINIEIDNSESI